MSIVSSRISSISSILKGPSSRSSLVGTRKKICFKLPTNLKTVLLNFENGSNRQEYQDMVCILRDSNVKDEDFLELLNELLECMSMLGPIHALLIEVILNVNWTDRSPEVITTFKRFVEDLMCTQIYHSKLIIDKLIFQFKSVNKGTLWINGKCPENFANKINHIHDLLRKFLKTIPMLSDILIQSLTALFPNLREENGLLATRQYVFALLQIPEYAPQLRKDILCLVIHRLITLDVSIPLSQILQHEEDEDMEQDDDEAIFQLDDPTVDQSSKQSNNSEIKQAIEALDVCMEQVLSYLYNSCHIDQQLQLDPLRNIYNDLLYVFERIILPTHASHHVQFIMFYFCSFKSAVVEAFIKWLWQKVSNPNVAPIIRQSAVSYIVSLSARATYVTVGLIQSVLSEMATWIHSYISSQDSLECANSDVRVHTVFYSVCQAMFYLLAFRHKDIIDGKRNLLFLQELNLTKIVTCRLNPLRVCQPAVMQNFAAVTRKYQLAYCYTVIERNSRNTLPVLETTSRFINWLDTFFPFDPYLLELSGQKITPIYNNSLNTTNNSTDSFSSKSKSECDENDFMDESFSSQSLESHNYLDKFSYSTSPGFIYT